MSSPRPGPIRYLPVRLDADGQVNDVSMLKLADGRIALLAYTALDRSTAAVSVSRGLCSTSPSSTPCTKPSHST